MLGSAIKNLVIVKMEEYTPYGPLAGVTPPATLLAASGVSQLKPVEEYIDQTLTEAANEMLWVVPVYIAGYKTATVTAVPDEEDNRIGTIVMPSDFLRLHTLRMASWTKPVHFAYPANSPAETGQHMVWTRGTKQKPVVIMKGIAHEAGTPVTEKAELAYYSVDAATEHEVKEFKYIPRFNASNEYGNVVAELIALRCAQKIYGIYGNIEQMKLMETELNTVLGTLQQ